MVSQGVTRKMRTSPTTERGLSTASRRGNRAPRRHASAQGFTLLEIGISLAVLVLAFTLAMPSIQAVTGVRMRSAAGQLGSQMRALYNEAALGGHTCRIVFDLDARQYWPECAPNDAKISSVKEEARDGQRFVDALKEQENAEKLVELQRDNPLQAQLEAKTAFGAYADPEVKKAILPDGVSFASVWVSHQSEPYIAGIAYLYFFPQGHSERALITLKQKEDYITVQESSLTGRAVIVDGTVEVPKS
jgi:general secretion pathway protein H